MAFNAQVLRVMIASPGDTLEERDAIERALHGWNADRAEREQVVLLPVRWETTAVPRLGGSGQNIINEQLVDRSDILIALFDARLGQATKEAVSGTAEEIERAHSAGKPVHVWFSAEPIPRDADLGQLQALAEFKRELQSSGLLGDYASPDDLGYKVRQAIESDLEMLDLTPLRSRPSQAQGYEVPWSLEPAGGDMVRLRNLDRRETAFAVRIRNVQDDSVPYGVEPELNIGPAGSVEFFGNRGTFDTPETRIRVMWKRTQDGQDEPAWEHSTDL